MHLVFLEDAIRVSDAIHERTARDTYPKFVYVAGQVSGEHSADSLAKFLIHFRKKGVFDLHYCLFMDLLRP